MRVVTDEFEIFEGKILDVFDGRIQFHPGQRPALAGKLLACLLKMVVVEMQTPNVWTKSPAARSITCGHHLFVAPRATQSNRRH